MGCTSSTYDLVPCEPNEDQICVHFASGLNPINITLYENGHFCSVENLTNCLLAVSGFEYFYLIAKDAGSKIFLDVKDMLKLLQAKHVILVGQGKCNMSSKRFIGHTFLNMHKLEKVKCVDTTGKHTKWVKICNNPLAISFPLEKSDNAIRQYIHPFP